MGEFTATAQNLWKKLGQATLNAASTLTADVNTPVLAYSGTWATGAQNPANMPAKITEDIPSQRLLGIKTQIIPVDANEISLMFALADTAGDDGDALIWLWDGNGPPTLALQMTLVAGTTKVETDPDTLAALTNFFYVDDVTPDTNNVGAVDIDNTDNGIAIVRFDRRRAKFIFADYDMDAGGGTTGTDIITWWNWL